MLELRHIFFGRALLGERPWQHEFCFEHRPRSLDHAVEGSGHPAHDRVLHPALNRGEDLAGVAFEPFAVEGFGHYAELDDEVAGKVFQLDLAALLAPEAEQGSLIVAHNDPRVRAANETASIGGAFAHVQFHNFLLRPN